jgi:chromosome segregation protein
MLKALELHGFKSFADKTRFEFPAGITVVVGPNGSGKSNIVDAIKWVLGEQSAKSLRGKDMSDVIFKGSGSSGRKPMNTAEATLVFENADKRLPIDAPEVHITRRVYRSGEGEYLINRQPCRLKDIKDLFRGTGLGGDAYSLIEQGKVDRLLQASAKDRRAIFEEAAGISRFKAKKVEAQRRLERVEQNMLRLTDIVEEVENRLKAVRSQASKARRYREYSDRLKQLRTQIALVDWRKLSDKLASIEADLTQAHEEVQTADARSQLLEARQLELETAVLTASEELRNCENQLASTRHQIAGQQSTIEFERTRSLELAGEIHLHGQNLLAMSDKAGDIRMRLKATEEELASARVERQASADDLTARTARLAELTGEYESAREQIEAGRQQYVKQLQAAAALQSQVEAGESRLTAALQAIIEHERQLGEFAKAKTARQDDLATAEEQQRSIAAQLAEQATQVEAAETELTECRNLHASRAADLAQLHGRQLGVAERAEMLEEFERTLEGIGAGVKQILEKAGLKRPGGEAESPSAGYPWSLIKGVVADLLQVSVEYAPAIDVALGEMSQAVVVEGNSEQLVTITGRVGELAGRVVAIATENNGSENSVSSSIQSAADTAEAQTAPPERDLLTIELTADMVRGVHVIARADKLVECQDEYRPLITRLLGRTFVVQTLADAWKLRAKAPAGTRFVTHNGELVDEHGAMAFGPRQSATSLVSRRSQLRAARLDLAVLDQQIIDAQRETSFLKDEVDRFDRALRQLVLSHKSLDYQAAAAAAAVKAAQQQIDQVDRQINHVEELLATANTASETTKSTLETTKQELIETQREAESLQASVSDRQASLGKLNSQRQEAESLATTAKVELARFDQRLEGLSLRMVQFQDDSCERERAIDQVRQLLQQATDRREASQLAILAATGSIAQMKLAEESLDSLRHDCMTKRDLAASQRVAVADELNALRKRSLKLRDKEHQLSLAAEQVRNERKTLADRLRDDYRIELADLTNEPSPEEASERAAVEEEIESLRRKINQIGAVNLDALDELDDLEKRFATLSGQHKDLTDAKQSLERIIHKINADSRRLFLETLEAIRVNFQALYRKAFGGGKADLLLEEGQDVLECGVEIMATPPGKPSFNNSLLSGGEKALTAVALLLAIFQFRPSPFCVLDEVDAPFDEANVGRFVDVLKEFLGWTRFVIVTHSKKTMTAATTLYGITMQESGVSKRVSVRFDDVTEDGHIRREALDRADRDQPQENAA